MAWTTPRTWQASDILSATLLNEQLRDNLNALKAPPSHSIVRNNDAAYATNSTTWVAVDATNLTATLTTDGGDVMVCFGGMAFNDGTTRRVHWDVQIDGVGGWAADQGFDGGISNDYVDNGNGMRVGFGPILISGLSAGVHTFTLMWKVGSGVVYLASDTNDFVLARNVPVIFWAREVS